MDNIKIKEKIEALSDEKYKTFHTSLCPNITEIIGVRVPKLRELAKYIVENEDIEKYLNNALNNSYEEILLQGMVLGLWKTDFETFSEHLENFIPKINSWAVCDVSVAGFKIIKKNMTKMWGIIERYLKSNKEYELRFAVVTILDYYIVPDYIDEVLKRLNNINHNGYYVKMAIAWAIQVCFVKFPEKTMELLKDNKIDNWTYNKSLQKILESYKVDDKTKNNIRKMKRYNSKVEKIG